MRVVRKARTGGMVTDMFTWRGGLCRAIAVTAGLTALTAACADPADQSLCTVYDRFQEAATQLRDVNLDGSTAGEAAERVETLIGQVRHLDAVADTRYNDQLDRLEDSLDNLLRVLESVPDDTEPATWEPLVEDSAEAARHEARVVTEVIAPACQTQDGG
jgi:hypothetical protein